MLNRSMKWIVLAITTVLTFWPLAILFYPKQPSVNAVLSIGHTSYDAHGCQVEIRSYQGFTTVNQNGHELLRVIGCNVWFSPGVSEVLLGKPLINEVKALEERMQRIREKYGIEP